MMNLLVKLFQGKCFSYRDMKTTENNPEEIKMWRMLQFLKFIVS